MHRARHGALFVFGAGPRRHLSEELVEFGRRLPRLNGNKKYRVGTYFVHTQLGYRGIVLFPWEARLLGHDENHIISKQYYQALVDARDAEELPMELETLRVTDETDKIARDIKPIRFKNWDIVPHEEIMRYYPSNSERLIFKHHLLHHFLAERKQRDSERVRVRATPTLNYWQKKFSSDPLTVNRATEDMEKSQLTIDHIPYHLCQKADSHLVAHLARFTFHSLEKDPIEITERITVVTRLDGQEEEFSQLMSIYLGGDFNHIYQHSRHVEVPQDTDTIQFVYVFKVDEQERHIAIAPVQLHTLL